MSERDRSYGERRNPRSTASVLGHPLHPLLVPFPIVCFIGALLSDITYANTADMQWANFSVWLLTFGLIGGALALATGMIDFFGDRAVRSIAAAWVHGIGNGIVMLLALWNVFVHSRDAWTSVVPTGLILSIVTVVLMGVTGWLGGTLVYRHRVGVRN
jgi:uncharacterized membrane protein